MFKQYLRERDFSRLKPIIPGLGEEILITNGKCAKKIVGNIVGKSSFNLIYKEFADKALSYLDKGDIVMSISKLPNSYIKSKSSDIYIFKGFGELSDIEFPIILVVSPVGDLEDTSNYAIVRTTSRFFFGIKIPIVIDETITKYNHEDEDPRLIKCCHGKTVVFRHFHARELLELKK